MEHTHGGRREGAGRKRVKHPRCILLGFKVTKAEARIIRGMAARAKLTVSAFILRRLLEGK